MSARLISCRRQCQEEQQYPPQINESPNLREESCQGSGSGEGSAEGSEWGSGGSAEEPWEGSAEEAIEEGEFRCSTGRNITVYNVCDGEKDCRSLGEDETFEECYQIFKDDPTEPHKLCYQLDVGNKLVPQFPCFKSGHCISSKLVR